MTHRHCKRLKNFKGKYTKNAFAAKNIFSLSAQKRGAYRVLYLRHEKEIS